MSKEKDTQPTLLQGVFPANPSQSQEKEKEQMTIDTSGMKLLESSESVNLDGSLGKMLKVLLTSKTAWSSDRSVLTWKKKVSKSNVLLFQLQASVRGIKGKGSGLLLKTPTTQDARIGINNIGGNKHRIKRGSIALADQILFPTPRSCEMEGGVVKNVEINNGSFSRLNKKGVRFGVKLKDAIHHLLPTPTNSEHKYRLKGNTQASKCLEATARKAGGKLNPNFVEFLMAYPTDWTKIEPTE
jgi:hypothetical protein